MQPAEPVPSLYLPGRHAEHVPPSEPVYPDTHLQSSMASLPELLTECSGQLEHELSPVAEEFLSAPQSMQLAEPISFLYLPGRHASHVPPSEPVYPDTH